MKIPLPQDDLFRAMRIVILTRYTVWMKKILFVVIFIGAIGLIFFWSPSRPESYIVLLTPQGFTPKLLTIRQGSTVTFRSETNNAFWPASNLHPEHSIYAEFDPMRPLEPKEEWSFVFTRTGVWGFHDHIRSYFTGTITVK